MTLLGYVPHPVARSQVLRKTGVIGLVFPYSSAFVDRDPFWLQTMSGVFEEAIQQQQNIMLIQPLATIGTRPARVF